MISTIKEKFSADKKNIYFFGLFKKGKINSKLIFLGILGVLLLVISAALDFSKAPIDERAVPAEIITKNQITPLNYEGELENKLANILSQIKGAGRVSVSITLENGASLEHAKNIVRESRTIEERDSSGGLRTTTEIKESEQILLSKEANIDKPVIAREYKPVIKGVVIVAEGALDSTVKLNITKAAEKCLGLAPHKIMVLAQRK